MTTVPYVLGENYSGKFQLVMTTEFTPQQDWVITRSDGQPDSETMTFPDGVQYKRTFTYNGNGFLIRRSAWEKQ